MKKIVLLGMAVSVGLYSFAQNSIGNIKPFIKTQKTEKIRPAITGDEVIPASQINPYVKPQRPKVATPDTIGSTAYDLQTNNSVAPRLIVHSNGTISACWTWSAATTTAFGDRRTAYNYFDGTAWGTSPTAGIDNIRTGWPCLTEINGNDYIVAHNSPSGINTVSSPVGANTWSNALIASTSAPTILWPRMKSDGVSKIHMVGLTLPTGNGGTAFEGQDGAIRYFRSLDGGATWESPVALPGMDSSQYIKFRGDNYSIDVKGETVAIVFSDTWQDTFMEISYDGGTTWTKKMILQFPFPKYAIGPGTLIDQTGAFINVTSSDGSSAVLIDNSGLVHVFFGTKTVRDTVIEADPGSATWYPNQQGIAYWNETLPEPYIVAEGLDLNGDGAFNPLGTGTERWGYYFSTATSMPNVGIDVNNNIYLVYSSVVETTDDGNGLSYRNIYAVKSKDNGCSWSKPTNVTPDDYSECVYPTVAKNVGGTIDFWYQSDGIPGTCLQDPAGGTSNPNHPVGSNDIFFVRVPVTDLNDTIAVDSVCFSVGVKQLATIHNTIPVVYPNPAKDQVSVLFSTEKNVDIKVSVVNFVGQEVYTTANNGSGFVSIELNISKLDAGLYFVRTQVNGIMYINKFIKE